MRIRRSNLSNPSFLSYPLSSLSIKYFVIKPIIFNDEWLGRKFNEKYSLKKWMNITDGTRYYSNDYYGGGAKKFSGIVEALTVMGNSLRAQKILSVIKRVKINGGHGIVQNRANEIRELLTKEI